MEGQIPTLDRFPSVRRIFRRRLFTVGLEAHPFHIGWYNDLVEPAYKLDYDPDTIAFVVISGPDTFERTTLRYWKEQYSLDPNVTSENPIDESMTVIFDAVAADLNEAEWDSVIIKDFDVDESTPLRRPKVLVQTAAHVAGAVEYFHAHRLEKFHLDDDNWMADAKLFGVAIHPQYGGWFGIRAVIICKALVLPDLRAMSRPQRPLVVANHRMIWHLLREFCTNWQEDTWRDIIPRQDSRRYSPLFKAFLNIERGIKRWEFLRDNGHLVTGPNDYDVSGDTEYDD